MGKDGINVEKVFFWGLAAFLFGLVLYYLCPTFLDHQIYTFLKDLITLLFTGMGLYIANGGLFTWKKQIKNEVADNLHLSLLKLRDAIRHVRNPAIFPSEDYKAMQYASAKYPDKPKEELEKNVHPYVYEMRWEEIATASTELELNLLKAEVLWGTEIRKLIKPLYGKLTELNIALKQNFQPELRTKDYMEIHNAMYDKRDWLNDREDKFGEEVKKVIEEVKKYINRQIS